MRQNRALVAVVALAMAAMVLVAPPAGASASGRAVFHCTAYLTGYPSPADTGVCTDGVTPATAVVGLVGVTTNGAAYTVNGGGDFYAEFSYSTPCIAGEPPATWTVSGAMYIFDAPATRDLTSTTADVRMSFSGTGSPAGFAFTSSYQEVIFGSGGMAQGSIAFGEASLIPLLGVSNTCPAGGPVAGPVEGEIDFVN